MPSKTSRTSRTSTRTSTSPKRLWPPSEGSVPRSRSLLEVPTPPRLGRTDVREACARRGPRPGEARPRRCRRQRPEGGARLGGCRGDHVRLGRIGAPPPALLRGARGDLRPPARIDGGGTGGVEQEPRECP